MKPLLIFICLIASTLALFGQKGLVQVQKPDGWYDYYYSDAGKVSTLTYWDRDRRQGYAVAYNVEGEEVYRSDISRIGGSHSVRFQYHPNGVVRQAHYHWQPDGGIQWGGKYTTFDEKGNKTGERDEINPMDPVTVVTPATDPRPRTDPPPPKPGKIIVEEAAIFQTRFYFINRTRKPLTVVPTDKSGQRLDNERAHPVTLLPGDTAKSGEYINAGFHEHPANYFDFRLEARKEKWLRNVGIRLREEKVQLKSPERGAFYFEVKPAR